MTPKDKRTPGFWITDNELIEVFGPQIGPYGLAVYGALAMHAGQCGTCDPSISGIAREIGASPRKVRSTIGELAGIGLIEVEHRPTGAGRNHEPNAYTLLPVAKLAKYTGQSTTLSAEPTALGAAPLRHDVPNPTALSAYKQEHARTEEDNDIAASTGDAADPAPPKPRQRAAKPKAPTPVTDQIALDLTGRTEVQPKDRALIYPIATDIRKLVHGDPYAGVDVWEAFRDARQAADEWDGKFKRVTVHNARNEFGRWSKNGGASTIRAILAQGDGGEA